MEQLKYTPRVAKQVRKRNTRLLMEDPNAEIECEVCLQTERATIFKGLPYGSDNCRKIWEAENGRYDPSRVGSTV